MEHSVEITGRTAIKIEANSRERAEAIARMRLNWGGYVEVYQQDGLNRKKKCPLPEFYQGNKVVGITQCFNQDTKRGYWEYELESGAKVEVDHKYQGLYYFP